MITEQEYLKALEVVKAYQKQVNEQVKDSIAPSMLKKDVTIEELGLSVRGYTAMLIISQRRLPVNHPIRYFKEKISVIIDFIAEEDFWPLNNCGKSTITEIKNVLLERGFRLKQFHDK